MCLHRIVEAQPTTECRETGAAVRDRAVRSILMVYVLWTDSKEGRRKKKREENPTKCGGESCPRPMRVAWPFQECESLFFFLHGPRRAKA